MKSDTFVLDTSFISSLLNQADVNHQQAVEIYQKFPQQSTFVVPRTVELELAILQAKLLPDADVQGFLSEIGVVRIDIDQKFVSGYGKFVQDTNSRAKTVDLSVLFVTKEYQGQLVTLDKWLARQLD